MKKLIAVVPQLTDSHRTAIRACAEAHGYEVLFYENAADAEASAKDAEIILSASTALAKAAPELKWMCLPFAGADPFLEPGVFASPDAVLTCSSGAYGVAIAEHVVMVALEILRRQPDYDDIVRRRGWKRDLPIRSILGSRITMLGTGNIGQETAVRLRAFAPARIVGVNRGGGNPGGIFDLVLTADRLGEILPKTDLLVISLPGTGETRRMLDAERIAMLPDGAILVNVGRGAVVDRKALEEHLRAGRLFAALDVFEEEPIPQDDPIWSCPNLRITPHVAGNMMLPHTADRVTALFLENLGNYFEGRPLLRRIDFRKGY